MVSLPAMALVAMRIESGLVTMNILQLEQVRVNGVGDRSMIPFIKTIHKLDCPGSTRISSTTTAKVYLRPPWCDPKTSSIW